MSCSQFSLNRSLFLVLLATSLFALPARNLPGQVFLDFTDFSTRMGELTTSAGIDAFTGGELTSIQDGIESALVTAFAGFDGIAFSQADPGGIRAELLFGLTASPGALGVADHIDFLNRDLADTARVFSANFDFIVDEFTGSTDRATQISQLTAALGGTAIHELGHNLGLRHHDAYGNLTYTGTPIATGGVQNLHVMATGSTGLGEIGRETARVFSINSLAKLAYADTSFTSGQPVALTEGADFGGTTGTASSISFESIPVASRFGETIVGELVDASDIDVFSFDLAAGSVFTADINVDYDTGTPFVNANTMIEFIDTDGSTVLFTDLVSIYSSTTFGSGGSGDGFDPAFFNIPIVSAGTYFLRVAGEAGGFGDYQLLMHTDIFAGVPEPGSLFLLGAAGIGVACIRRRRNVA